LESSQFINTQERTSKIETTTKASLLDILINDKKTDEPIQVTTMKERIVSNKVTEDYRTTATNSAINSQGSSNNNNIKNEASSANALASSSSYFTSSQPPNRGYSSSPSTSDRMEQVSTNKVGVTSSETSGVDNKKSESDEKNKSSLSDLLTERRTKSNGDDQNGKEITFSVADKSVPTVSGSSDTKYYPPPPKNEPTANNNFHKPGADTTPPPAKTLETINPHSSVNNWEQRSNEKIPSTDKSSGSLNDLLSTKVEPGVKWSGTSSVGPPAPPAPGSPEGPHSQEDDVHRKYVFYLLFGNSNCNCPGNSPSGPAISAPKVSVNQVFNANGTRDIKWVDGNSAGALDDGEGGSFYIGYRKGGGAKGSEKKAGEQEIIIQPRIEIKMSKEERACNSVFSSFFG